MDLCLTAHKIGREPKTGTEDRNRRSSRRKLFDIGLRDIYLHLSPLGGAEKQTDGISSDQKASAQQGPTNKMKKQRIQREKMLSNHPSCDGSTSKHMGGT